MLIKTNRRCLLNHAGLEHSQLVYFHLGLLRVLRSRHAQLPTSLENRVGTSAVVCTALHVRKGDCSQDKLVIEGG